MKHDYGILGAAAALLLLGALAANAAPPASLFKGGSFDGYSRADRDGRDAPGLADGLDFMGGPYDGFSRQTLGPAAIPPDPSEAQ